MLSGENAFEISDIQEDETEARETADQDVTMIQALGSNFERLEGVFCRQLPAELDRPVALSAAETALLPSPGAETYK
jgi:hypothetical protein